MTTWTDEGVAAWEARGTRVPIGGHDVFYVDAPATGTDDHEPLLVIHGFPTSSYDYVGVLADLNEHRRVVLMDLLGYGLSAKPDQRYTMAGQADIVQSIVATAGLERFALLTHDMGDTVGGELLARHTAGEWDVEVTRRVVTNGSIYIEMAHLTDGQKLLLSLPDEVLPEQAGADPLALGTVLAATLAEKNHGMDLTAHAELVIHDGGNRIMPRLIRYIILFII